MIDKRDLYKWCTVPAEELEHHPQARVKFRLAADSAAMGKLMAEEFAQDIAFANSQGRHYRAIVPCGPKCWYRPFAEYVNRNHISLRNVTVFHMDECLDWQGKLLDEEDPYNFRTFMLREFYGPILPELNVPHENRYFLSPSTMFRVQEMLAQIPADYTLGGWGQDGHIAYNQSRRQPYSKTTLDEIRESTVRIQENNWDTVIALGQRTYGGAYQFVPPMSVTLGVKECLSAKKVRLFSDTGEWKQTALRAALFSEPDPEYPITLLQDHEDAVITATYNTADHPIAHHPEWKIRGVNV